MGSAFSICGTCNLDIQQDVQNCNKSVKDLKKDVSRIRDNHLFHVSADIAGLKKDVKYMSKDIKEIKETLKDAVNQMKFSRFIESHQSPEKMM